MTCLEILFHVHITKLLGSEAKYLSSLLTSTIVHKNKKNKKPKNPKTLKTSKISKNPLEFQMLISSYVWIEESFRNCMHCSHHLIGAGVRE
jgi:hypothetical protein